MCWREFYRDNTTVTLENSSFDYTGSGHSHRKPVVIYESIPEGAQAVTLTEGTRLKKLGTETIPILEQQQL